MCSKINELTFVAMMKKLSNFYSDFGLNEKQTSAWFPYFRNYTDVELGEAIQLHIKNEVWNPTVASLTKYIKQVAVQQFELDNGSSEKIVEGIIRELSSTGIIYNPDKYFEAVKNKFGEVAERVAQDYKTDLKGLTIDGTPFLKQRMIKTYNSYLEREVTGANNMFEALETQSKLKIESKE
ncbi:hypothetical protein [Culicoidibacter larvae]|uniref:Replicative helicase inhibitor G39P N-terminal domain-containing protein n=1 Tax=Culicoidibacter larvae TaxID=2579976 RepID=A0A5R8Q9N6_9FIRM|nr:hypothetical protein [Culicoidibacter larvae]TLG72079.1 hypothetical protein FEZ08_09610 [Culicoidibacter larvae]